MIVYLGWNSSRGHINTDFTNIKNQTLSTPLIFKRHFSKVSKTIKVLPQDQEQDLHVSRPMTTESHRPH